MPHPSSLFATLRQGSLAGLLVGGMLLSQVQPVQARPLLATFGVNTTADTADASPGNGVCADAGGNCSLRAAISEANMIPGPDTIILPAGTYQLTIPNNLNLNEDDNASGDLDINDSLTITGSGSGSTIIQAGTDTNNGIDKVFGANPFCANGVNVSITGVTIRYGRNTQPHGAADFSHTGGGIDWCGGTTNESFALSNSVVSDNTNVNGYGGGLNIDSIPGYTGQVNITNVTFSNNQTLGTSSDVNGGGIHIFGNQPAVTITNSTFTNNRAASGRNGGGIYYRPSYGGSLNISNSTFTGNSATFGGGIELYPWTSNTSIAIQDFVFTGNTANYGGGLSVGGAVITATPIQLTNLTITGNNAAIYGGGVFVDYANATLVDSRIVNNTGLNGAGLYKSNQSTTVTASNNWWGCSTGPTAAPCNAAIAAGGTLTNSPYFRNLVTSSVNPLVTNQTATLTSSFLTNSAGSTISTTHLQRVVGLPTYLGGDRRLCIR